MRVPLTTTTNPTLFFFVAEFQVYDFDDEVQYRGWFLLFCLFWTLNFITAMGQVSYQQGRANNGRVAYIR